MNRSSRIALSPSIENAIEVIESARDGLNSSYTHSAIAEWAQNFWANVLELEIKEPHCSDKDCPICKADQSEIRRYDLARNVLGEVYTAWWAFLGSLLPVREINASDHADVLMPSEWFDRWSVSLRDIRDAVEFVEDKVSE